MRGGIAKGVFFGVWLLFRSLSVNQVFNSINSPSILEENIQNRRTWVSQLKEIVADFHKI